MTNTTTPPAPVLATIAKHGAPTRALWYGTAEHPPEAQGRPCTIRRADNRWYVQVDNQQPWLVGPRARVWLSLLPPVEHPEPGPAEYVRNPWSVVLGLARPTMSAYRHLATALTVAANAANAAAVDAAPIDADAAADLRAVRDALRAASTATLLGRLSDNPTPCRRCGAACTNCTPPAVPA